MTSLAQHAKRFIVTDTLGLLLTVVAGPLLPSCETGWPWRTDRRRC